MVGTVVNRLNRPNIPKPVGLVPLFWNSGWFGSLLFEPVNQFSVSWINPEGTVNSDVNAIARPRIPRGSRLTPGRLVTMRICTGFLTDSEKPLLIDILFKYEDVITSRILRWAYCHRRSSLQSSYIRFRMCSGSNKTFVFHMR